MGNFPVKQVKRSIRNYESAASDILNSSHTTYMSKVERFVYIAKNDPIINSIVGPLLNSDIDLNSIHTLEATDWIPEFNLPINIDEQIAYMMKMFDLMTQGQINLDQLSFAIYRNNNFSRCVELWMGDVAVPSLRELSYRLNDLIEDEVQGKDEVSAASLQIFNYGSITATDGGNVAIGKDIQQTINYEQIINELMEKIKASNLISDAQLPEVESVVGEIQKEIKQTEPSVSKLQKFAGKLYQVGEEGLLKLVTNAITDPRWGQAVANVMLGILS